jgi:hypothetical protein
MTALRELLMAMKEEAPETKTGFVRQVLPEIEEALKSGHRIKAIWRRLHDGGFKVSYADFCTYLRRVRAQQSRGAALIQRNKQSQASTTKQSVGDQTQAKRDPFANLSRVEGERTVFNYRGTQDLEELVYGKRKNDKPQ